MARFKSVDELLLLFPEKPRTKIKNGYNIICPAHSDKDPSLSVSVNGSKILLHCQAGCDTQAVLKTLNISEADLFLNEKKIETVYQYQNLNGEVIYEVVRYDPKGFTQRRPDGNGGYIWNVEGVEKVIYYLPAIKRAAKLGETIFITEGEADAENLWKIGLIATCNPSGAGKWKPEYSHQLSGANLAIIPDADEVGIKHALDVADSTSTEANSVKLLEPFKDAKDVSEWIKQGHTREELETLVENTPYYDPNVHGESCVNTNNNINIGNTPSNLENVPVGGQVTGQVLDNFETETLAYGGLAGPFDEFLEENPQWHDKRFVATYLGKDYTHPAFVKLVQRRSKKNPNTGEPPKIRVSSNGQRIKWINNDWRSNLILPTTEEVKPLGIKLPFGMESLVDIPPRTVIVCGGEVDAGKSHYAYEFADLNLGGNLPIRHFINELGESRARRWLDDYPELKKAWEANDGRYSMVNLDDTGNGLLDIAESLDPEGINIYDYLHIMMGDGWWQEQAELLKRFALQIPGGVLLVNLQKPEGSKLPYGRDTSKFQADVMVTLWVEEQRDERTRCRLDIEKAKDYSGTVNPKSRCIRYVTGGLYGRLEAEGAWEAKPKKDNR